MEPIILPHKIINKSHFQYGAERLPCPQLRLYFYLTLLLVHCFYSVFYHSKHFYNHARFFLSNLILKSSQIPQITIKIVPSKIILTLLSISFIKKK